jgi:hypothetical protein
LSVTRQLFLAVAQGRVGLLQLPVDGFLGDQQLSRFEARRVSVPLRSIGQPGGPKGQQQRQHADAADEDE